MHLQSMRAKLAQEHSVGRRHHCVWRQRWESVKVSHVGYKEKLLFQDIIYTQEREILFMKRYLA